jgi:hypothetical protein
MRSLTVIRITIDFDL